MISDRDRGLLLGDGLFETVLWTGRGLAAWGEHVARLQAGCAVIGLPAPAAARLHDAAVAAVEQAGLSDGRAAVRLTWTAGSGGRGLDRPDDPTPALLAAASPAPARTAPSRLAVSAVRRNDGSPAARLKTLAYLDNVLARREARLAGADEAVMLNTRGEVACAAAANLFWFEDDRLITPALSVGVLAGVARAAVLRLAPTLGLAVEEAVVRPRALRDVRGLFLTNSLIGVRPVAALDGASAAVHPAVALLAGALRREWSQAASR
jgi:branched-chain amino acid aminotransferase/4-amino-4-deoxychorismate lyase